MEFKDKLKSLREEKKLTQENLANEIYVSRSAVARWEAGLGIPSTDSVRLLCEFFKISKEELFPNDKAEELLVDKNKKIKKHKVGFIIMLCITLLLSIILVGLTIIKNYNERREELIRASIYPELKSVSLNYDNKFTELQQVYDQTVPINDGRYYLVKNQWYNLYFEIEIDKRIYKESWFFCAQINGESYQLSEPIESYEGDGRVVNTYYVSLKMLQPGEDNIEVINLKYYSYAEGEKNINLSTLQEIPIKVVDSGYVKVDVNFNRFTLQSFSVENGGTLAENIFKPNTYNSLLVETLINESIEALPFGKQLSFKGWNCGDEVGLWTPLFKDVTVFAEFEFSLSDQLDFDVLSKKATIPLEYDYKPKFALQGETYENVNYVMSCSNPNVKINGDLLRITKPIEETLVTVNYELGFYKGQTSFLLENSDYYRVEFFPGYRFKIDYDKESNDLLLSGENYQKVIEYYQELNSKYELETGVKREIKDFLRINKTAFLPIFDYDFLLETGEFSVFAKYLSEKGWLKLKDLPSEVVVEKGTKIAFSQFLWPDNWENGSPQYFVGYSNSEIVQNGVAIKEGEVVLYFQMFFPKVNAFSKIYTVNINIV